jgi:general secretion pathway protein G
MRFHKLFLWLAVVGMCVLAGCKEEDTLIDDVRGKYTEKEQELRKLIHRDGKVTRALTAYKFAIGDYPTTEQGLQALYERPSGLEMPEAWKGPYLDNEEDIIDPWGNQLKYIYPGNTHEGKYDIISAGPDGQFDTADDYLNHNLL